MMPNFSGAWSALIDRCVFRMPTPQALPMWIRHEAASIEPRVLPVWPDGAERAAELPYAIGGKVEARIGDRPAVVSAVWQGETLIIESALGSPNEPMRLRD